MSDETTPQQPASQLADAADVEWHLADPELDNVWTLIGAASTTLEQAVDQLSDLADDDARDTANLVQEADNQLTEAHYILKRRWVQERPEERAEYLDMA